MFNPDEDIEDLYRQAADKFGLESSGPDWGKISQALDKAAMAPVPGQAPASGGLLKWMTGGSRMLWAGAASAVMIAGVVVVLFAKKEEQVRKESGSPRIGSAVIKEAKGVTGAAESVSGAGTTGAAGSGETGGMMGAGGAGGSTGLSVTSGSGSVTGAEATGDAGSVTGDVLGATGDAGGMTGMSATGDAGSVSGAGTPQGAKSAGGGVGGEFPNDNLSFSSNSNTLLPLEQPWIATDRLRAHLIPLQRVDNVSVIGPVASPYSMGGRFYAGLSGAIEFSSVNGQALSQPGSSIGLLAGLSITKRLSVETGLYISHKVYYSSCENVPFAPQPPGLPPGSRLLSVLGHSTLTEIPLTLRYAFAAVGRGVFYAGAGASAYLPSSEKYDYQAIWFGRSKDGTFTPPGRLPVQWLSVFNANLGYRWNFGKTDMLRTELYTQLPLTGMGNGGLRVTSTGLSLSYIHAF